MTPEDQFRRNLDHTFAFLEGLIDNPADIERIPSGTTFVLMPKHDPELREANVAMAMEMRRLHRGEARRNRREALADATLFVNV